MKHAVLLAIVVALAPAALPRARAQESSPAARAALAHQLHDAALAALASGTGRPSEVYEWSARWLRADLEGHVASAAQQHFDRMTALATRVHGLVGAGMMPSSAELECQYYVAEARAWMAHPPSVP